LVSESFIGATCSARGEKSMPKSNLSDADFEQLREKMCDIIDTSIYGLYSGARGQTDEANRQGKKRFCNCWQSILMAGVNARLGYTKNDVLSAGLPTQGGQLSIAVYTVRHRRFIMFDRPTGMGIPSGLAKRGDIIMWGAGVHVALVGYGEFAYEFERTSERQGVKHINEIDERYPTSVVTCAPLPEPAELPQIQMSNAKVDLNCFPKEKIGKFYGGFLWDGLD
jgi:hypothetical protein